MTLTAFFPIPFDLIYQWFTESFARPKCGETPWYGWVFMAVFGALIICVLFHVTKTLGNSLDPLDHEREQIVEREKHEAELYKQEYLKKISGGYKPETRIDNQLKLAI